MSWGHFIPIFLGVFVGIAIVDLAKWMWRNNRWNKR